MKSLTNILAVSLVFVVLHSILGADDGGAMNELYFPPHHGAWESVDPDNVGWDRELLQKALDYAGDNKSSGVVILYQGRILAEQYFKVEGPYTAKYKARVPGKDEDGRAIEDVASAQKSVCSILVGIAQQKGMLKVDDRVSQHLEVGWSGATPEQENAITIRHLITMTSGLNDRGAFETQPGTKWRYNTTVYAKTMDVVASAAKMDRHQLTSQWLTQPLGMSDSKWVRRGTGDPQRFNRFGFATTARDLARFGLMVLADGKWGDQTVLADQQYLKAATTSSQNLNPFYGYLWWVNRNAFATNEARRFETAPSDMFSANGALNRRCFVVPSMQLVITRLGDSPGAKNKGFDRQFWKLISAAAPPEKNATEKKPTLSSDKDGDK